MNSFFAHVEYKKRLGNCDGKFTAEKLFTVEQYETVEKLIAFVHKILKTEREPEITFSAFDGYGNTDSCRIFRDYSGSCTFVVWCRNSAGYVSKTDVVEHIELNKKNVKKYVLEAIRLFREESARA